MRSLTTAETAALLTGVAHFRVEMKRPTDAAWTNLSATLGGDWVFGVRMDQETVDQPVGRFTVTLLKAADGYSSAPGISASPLNRDASLAYRPLVYPGSYLRVYTVKLGDGVTPSFGDYRLWLEGRAKKAAWAGDVVAECVTLDQVIEDTQIEEKEVRGVADPGTPIEDEVQGLLDRWMGMGVVPLRVIGTPDWGVGPYNPEGSLGAQIRALVQEQGWDIRYRWSDADNAFKYTFYLPPRDKTTTDLSLTSADILAVPDLFVSSENVRNAFSGEAVAADGTLITATDQDDASIAQFGRLWGKIVEGAKSSIKTLLQLTTLLGYAKSDLSQPPTEKKIQIPFLPWLELHDRLAIAADGQNFDFDGEWSIVGISHSVEAGADPYTELDLRAGSPVGMYLAWAARKLAGAGDEDGQILGRQIGRTETSVILTGERLGLRVTDIWAYEALVSQPFDPSTWPTPTGTPDAIYSAADFLATGHSALIPSEGKVRPVILVTKDATGASLWEWRYPVYPTKPDPQIIDVIVTGQRVQVIGNAGVGCIRLVQRGGDWDAFFDGNGLNVLTLDADTDGDPGISGTEVWTLDAFAYGVPKGEVTIGVTPSVTRSTTVYGPGIADPTAEPRLELVDALAPDDASSVMTIRVRAANIAGHTIKIYYEDNYGIGWTGELEISGTVSPVAGAAPTTTDSYTYDTIFATRTNDPSASVQVKVRVELLNGATVVDNDWDIVSWYVGT